MTKSADLATLLDSTSKIPVADLSATGTPSASTFLRGDGSWQAAGGGQIQSQVFTANGTWTAPTGVTRVRAVVIGGGGGNFGAGCGSQQGWQGGYAAGDYTVTPGTGYAITVGVGGAGVTTGTSAAGGTSSFAAFVSATGGSGTNSGGSGSPGAGSSGTLKNGNVGAAPVGVPPILIQGSARSTTNSPLAYTATNDAFIGGGGRSDAAARAGNTGVVYLEWVGT